MKKELSAETYAMLQRELADARNIGIKLSMKSKNAELHQMVNHIHAAEALLERLNTDLEVESWLDTSVKTPR